MNVPQAALLLALANSAFGQAMLSGKVTVPRWPGADAQMPLGGVLCVASLPGGEHEPAAFRSWETEPPGWFRLTGAPGKYTVFVTTPASLARPVVRNNVLLADGEKLDGFGVTPRFDFFNFHERAWDPKPAREYFQPFVARGRGVTHVAVRVASDGVDGAGPGKQNLLVSVHRRTDAAPDQWPQIGPDALIPDVDSGGPKNYLWSAGWNSGEVPLTPGETYAVRVRTEKPAGTFQTFWRTNEAGALAGWRADTNGAWSVTGAQLWLAVATDGDGLRVPFNKRVHKTFGAFAGFAPKWSQTWVTQGRGLAGVVLYAAVGGAQPPLSRQRATVRVRRGGPGGPVVGVEKLAIGNGNYTGDASWGVYCAAFAPGEVPLTPGETYAVEFESVENYETLHGFVNIKGQVSDDRAGFNPYRKHSRDDYAQGTAFKHGTEDAGHDLDMQIVEYEVASVDFARAVDATNLLLEGTFESAITPKDATAPPAWETFSLEADTRLELAAEAPAGTNHFLRASAPGGKKLNGGWVQRVGGLSRTETYRLDLRVRATWPLDHDHAVLVGCDPTGQTNNPAAETIRWLKLPPRHGHWLAITNAPVRPAQDAVSVWLRARSPHQGTAYAPFKADFDDAALRCVRME